MFNKLLMWFLKKRLKKLTPEEKQKFRGLVAKAKSETTETKQKQKNEKRRTKKMPEEIKKDENKAGENTSAENTATKSDVEETSTEKVDNSKETKTEESAETPVDKVEEPTAQVEPTQEPNGVRVADLVTKDMLADMFASLNAKLDAVVKENSDLKNKIAEKDGELDGMRDKYENHDFGNNQKQGIVAKDKSANDTFEEYSKSFM